MAEVRRRLTTIVVADIAGFSRLVGTDEEGTLAAQRRHRDELIQPLLDEYHGRIANTAGDSFLFEFPSAVEAVRCSLAIQEGMVDRNSYFPSERQIQYRIGINVGDVISDGDDLLGDGVNVAARLETLADPGGICISNAAHEQVRDRLEITFEDMGEIEVKNIARPVRVFRVLAEQETVAQAAAPARSVAPSKKTLVTVVMVIALIAAGGGAWWWQRLAAVEQTNEAQSVRPAENKPSIAVLPFANLSDDKEQEYFVDGMTDDLITDLSKLSGLIVIARNSVFTYKGRNVKVQEVARDLNVTHILEGSVRRAGGRVRINAQLIDANTGAHQWAEQFDRKLTDIFDLQDEVVENIVTALSISFGDTGYVVNLKYRPASIEAYEAYHRGWQLFQLNNVKTTASAIRYLHKAIELDPNYGRAYAALGYLYRRVKDRYWAILLGLRGGQVEAEQREHRYLKLALEHPTALAISLQAERLRKADEHDEAIALARKAVAMDPNDPTGLYNLGTELTFASQPGDAIPYFEQAIKLDPLNFQSYAENFALAQILLGKYKDATGILRKGLLGVPDDLYLLWYLAAAEGLQGNIEAAKDAATRVAEVKKAENKGNLMFGVWTTSFYGYKEDADQALIQKGLLAAGIPR